MERAFNTLMVFILSCVLLGALWIQFVEHETPCPLCYLQRIAMMGLGCSAFMNIRFGIRKSHYGMALFWCFFGGFVALRQMALHICPDFPAFGKPFMGISLYTWSFFIFSISTLYIGILLLSFDHQLENIKKREFYWWEAIVYSLLFFASFVNIIATLMQCGLGPCVD